MRLGSKKIKPTIEGSKRIGVFLDLSNISASAMTFFGVRVNFYELLQSITGDRQLISAIAYCVHSEGEAEDISGFYEQLKHIGFRLRTKVCKVYPDGSRKGDWDVGIAADTMVLAPKLDVAVIVSGDWDFYDLIEPLHSHGCSVEVYSFRQSTAIELREAADKYVDLSNSHFFMPN